MTEKQERLAVGLMSDPEQEHFKGYTIEELRFRRAVVAIKREYVKDKLNSEWARFRGVGVGPNVVDGKKKPFTGGLVANVMKMFSYADYIALGLTIFKGTRKIASLFKKKK
jgi:hypothetical protein